MVLIQIASRWAWLLEYVYHAMVWNYTFRVAFFFTFPSFFNIAFRLITELLFSLISLWNTRSTGICHLSFQNGRPPGLPIPPNPCSFFSPYVYRMYKLSFEAESHYLKQKWKHLELELWHINNPQCLLSQMGSGLCPRFSRLIPFITYRLLA